MPHPGSQLQEGPSGSYALERELGRCHASRHRGLRVRALAAALIVGGACSPSGAGSRPSPDSAAVPAAPASFVNRVWVVAESPQVERGEMRVFLSDSTLVMTSPHGTPAFGTWRVRNGQLTITEEGETIRWTWSS